MIDQTLYDLHVHLAYDPVDDLLHVSARADGAGYTLDQEYTLLPATTPAELDATLRVVATCLSADLRQLERDARK